MARIYTIGETLLDIFIKDGQAIASRPGGAMLNTAISLGRLGLPVYLISEYANDQVGQTIDHFLLENNVSSDYIYHYKDGRTALAMAFLDDQNEAKYTFYKQYPKGRLKIKTPDFTPEDIILFGSFYALLPDVRNQILAIIKKARRTGALIIYDPNIRSPHKKQISKLKGAISENISLADIIRGSNEDFNTIFDINNQNDALKEVLKHDCQHLIYTMNKDGVYLLYDQQSHYYKVPGIETVSTVGAGDSFNAGLIYAIWKNKLMKDDINNLPFEVWSSLIEEGISFSSDVCQSLDNYISVELARRLSK